MSIAVVPTMQMRVRALNQACPELTAAEIAKRLGARPADVRHALQAKQMRRQRPVA